MQAVDVTKESRLWGTSASVIWIFNIPPSRGRSLQTEKLIGGVTFAPLQFDHNGWQLKDVERESEALRRWTALEHGEVVQREPEFGTGCAKERKMNVGQR